MREQASDEGVPLGRSHLRVSRVVLGTMARHPETPAEAREELFRYAIDRGLTTLDTAPLYGHGETERAVGNAIRSRREQVVLCSKVGLRWENAEGEVLFSFVADDGRTVDVRRDSRPEAVRADVEGSLRRLRVDHIDLVQVHQLDRKTPIERTMEALRRLVDEGKVGAIGVSNYPLADAERARKALDSIPLACLQLPFSLLDRTVEAHVVPWARRNQVGLFAYSPLAEGRLAKDVGFSWNADSWHAHASNRRAITRVIDHVSALASVHGVSRAAVAIGWLLTRPGIHPVIGVSRRSHVDDAIDAMKLMLTAEDVARLDRAAADSGVDVRAGERRRHRFIAKVLRAVRPADRP